MRLRHKLVQLKNRFWKIVALSGFVYVITIWNKMGIRETNNNPDQDVSTFQRYAKIH